MASAPNQVVPSKFSQSSALASPRWSTSAAALGGSGPHCVPDRGALASGARCVGFLSLLCPRPPVGRLDAWTPAISQGGAGRLLRVICNVTTLTGGTVHSVLQRTGQG